jgi:ATP phosphoribosyltransferase
MTKLVIAIPSKGRLQEQTLDYLADAGMKLVQSGGARDYTAKLSGADNVSVSLLSAAEIAEELLTGRVHMGVTGEDLLAENNAESHVNVIERLGFGRADVVVAVPRSWIDVSTMADLDDVAAAFHGRHQRKLRVATKFVTLARRFFADHGIADYRIIESLGATEGAPAAGTAEVIVDITTTGATLTANELKILDDGVILKSEASLAASLRASWSPTVRDAARAFLDRIGARVLGKASRMIELPGDAIEASLMTELTASGASVVPSDRTSGSTSLLVPERNGRCHRVAAAVAQARRARHAAQAHADLCARQRAVSASRKRSRPPVSVTARSSTTCWRHAGPWPETTPPRAHRAPPTRRSSARHRAPGLRS